jgi:hypothetical protein
MIANKDGERRHSRVPDFNKPRHMLTGQQLTIALLQEAAERKARIAQGLDPDGDDEQGAPPPAGASQPQPPPPSGASQPPPPPPAGLGQGPPPAAFGPGPPPAGFGQGPPPAGFGQGPPPAAFGQGQGPPPVMHPQDIRRQQPAPPPMPAPADNVMQAPPPAASSTMKTCICPYGAGPGQAIPIIKPDGSQLLVNVPAGVLPGMSFQVLMPDEIPTYGTPTTYKPDLKDAATREAEAYRIKSQTAAAQAKAALAAGQDADESELTMAQLKYKQKMLAAKAQELVLQQKVKETRAAPRRDATIKPTVTMPPIAKNKQQQKKKKKLGGGGGGGSFLSAMKKQVSKTGMAKMKAAGKVASGLDAPTSAVQGARGAGRPVVPKGFGR